MLALLAMVVAAWVLVRSQRNTEPGGCLFGDGRSYCLMADGHRAAAPFSRRILGPILVQAIHFGSLATRFAVVDVAGLAATGVAIVVLTRTVGAAAGLTSKASGATGVIATSLWLLSPYGLRDVVYAPTLVDDPALGFGMLCLAIMLCAPSRPKPPRTAPSRPKVALAGALALCAVLTRESWALPLVVAAVVYTRPWRRGAPGRQMAAGIVTALVAGTGIGLSRAYSGVGVSPSHVAAQRLAYYGRLHGVMDLAYQATLAVGVLPLVVVGSWAVARRRGDHSVPAVAALAAAAAVHLLQGTLEGTDVGRIAYPALAICAVLVSVILAASPSRWMRRFAWFAVAITIGMFHPWMALSGPESAYPRHLYYHGGLQAVQVATSALIVVGGAGLWWRHSRDPRHPVGAVPRR